MSFDFFNEGIKQESNVEFTKEQNDFLGSKLPFLDPKSTKQIFIGNALQFLKFSGIRSEGIQKILRNCKIQSGTKTINYDQMKKIFRGVALHQADIQPSTINIEANIKTKMPIFYDDQSDQDTGHQAPPPNPPPKTHPPQAIPTPTPTQPKISRQNNQLRHQKPVSDKSGVFSFDAAVKPTQTNPKQMITSPTFLPQQSIAKEKETALGIKIREFELRWQKLKTSGNKIQGGQVKNLFKNAGERSNLSRAWKLCCLTHSGALTKGQFYVFLELIASSHIPQALTPEMKQCISMLDQPKNLRSKQNLQPSHRASSQNPSSNKLASSQLFQNFGKAQSNVEGRVRVKTEQKIDLVAGEKLVNASSQLQQMSKVTENHNEQLTVIRRGQESMNNLMGQIEQFLTVVKGRNSEVKEQLQELKNNQQMLNERLNKVCVAMNGIIVHQNSLIEELVTDYTTQNNLNQQRVAFLEQHVLQLTEQLQQKTIAIKTITRKIQQPSQAQKSAEPQPPLKQASPKPQPKVHHQEETEAVDKKQQITQQVQHPQQQNFPEGDKNQEEQRKREQMQYQQRMKMKRAQVIQLIMHLTPLSPQEEPALIQRISQYSEQELNTVYYNCYQKLKARQVAEQQQAERLQQERMKKVNQPPEDDFNSSNFHGQPATTQQDMFG